MVRIGVSRDTDRGADSDFARDLACRNGNLGPNVLLWPQFALVNDVDDARRTCDQVLCFGDEAAPTDLASGIVGILTAVDGQCLQRERLHLWPKVGTYADHRSKDRRRCGARAV